MTFDEWLESYFSGTQIDDVIVGMMRTAFEAGKCESGKIGLADKFAMAFLMGRLSDPRAVLSAATFASDAYALADAMLKERMK